MKITIEVHEFHDRFLDVIPYFQELNTRRVVECLIDDFNGVLNLSMDAGNGQKVDYSKISNTLEYVTKDSVGVISEAGMSEMRRAVAELVFAFFESMSHWPCWANMRFRYHNHRIRRGDGMLTLVMEGENVYDYNSRICELIVRTARSIMEGYRAYDDRAY